MSKVNRVVQSDIQNPVTYRFHSTNDYEVSDKAGPDNIDGRKMAQIDYVQGTLIDFFKRHSDDIYVRLEGLKDPSVLQKYAHGNNNDYVIKFSDKVEHGSGEIRAVKTTYRIFMTDDNNDGLIDGMGVTEFSTATYAKKDHAFARTRFVEETTEKHLCYLGGVDFQPFFSALLMMRHLRFR